jgi:hypothetical protein
MMFSTTAGLGPCYLRGGAGKGGGTRIVTSGCMVSIERVWQRMVLAIWSDVVCDADLPA